MSEQKIADILPFPQPVARPHDMDDYELLEALYDELGGWNHYPPQQRDRLRSFYWEINDRLFKATGFGKDTKNEKTDI